VLGLVPEGVAVADVGTGDGHLAAWLAAGGRRVLATENKSGPRAVAARVLDPLGIECRLGDGLQPILPGEVKVAVLAGLGGRAIFRILQTAPAVVVGLDALILQPMQHLAEMIEALEAADYRILERLPVDQGRHRYAVLRVLPPYSIGGYERDGPAAPVPAAG